MALVVAGLLVQRATGAFVPPATAVRVRVALGACVAVGLVVPRLGKLVTPVAAAVVAAAFLAVLVVTREVGSADLAMVKGVVRKK